VTPCGQGGQSKNWSAMHSGLAAQLVLSSPTQGSTRSALARQPAKVRVPPHPVPLTMPPCEGGASFPSTVTLTQLLVASVM
jgi:hypothetical protein